MICSSCQKETNQKVCGSCGQIPIKRGDMWLADLSGIDPYQRELVPVVCIQNNMGNKHSPTTIVIIGSIDFRVDGFTERVDMMKNFGVQSIYFDCELITTVDKSRLIKPIMKLNNRTITRIEKKVARATMGLYKLFEKIG
ncbi:hypothetical protein CHH83_17320 [Bacillus sp. 7586-K]|nr:hypothetical protein CHH83_17320 [Bacillus sp. 7586-K]